MAILQHFGYVVAQKRYVWCRENSLISFPRGSSKEMARWACRVNFFYFFRLLRALAGIRVAWFVEIRRLVGSLVLAKDMLFSVSKHVKKSATRTTTKCSAEYLILQGQPDVESRRTKLPGYPQELGEVEKNKKKFTRRAHLTISLLKPRGEEINVFHLYHLLRFWATTWPKCCRIAISSRISKFSLFFSKPPESFEYTKGASINYVAIYMDILTPPRKS